MEPEGSLPYSQELANCHYPLRDQSRTCIHSASWSFNLISSSHTPRSSNWPLSLTPLRLMWIHVVLCRNVQAFRQADPQSKLMRGMRKHRKWEGDLCQHLSLAPHIAEILRVGQKLTVGGGKFLGAFTQLRKAAISSVMSIRPSASHSTDYR